MIRIMKADLFQRIRIPSFFVTVAMLLFLSVISTPRAKGVIQVLSIDPTVYRQADNPSWLPSSAALILGLILPIIGFLFIRNSLSLDRETGVADLFMTRSFHRFRYVFGKFTANCLLLVSLWLTVVIGTFFMSILRFPGQWLSMYQFLSPFLVLLPGILLLSALALLADTLPFLRGTFGTIAMIFFLLILYVLEAMRNKQEGLNLFNLSGTNYILDAIKQAGIVAGKPINGLQVLSSGKGPQSGTLSLVIPAIDFKPSDLIVIGIQIVICIFLVLLSAFLLNKRIIVRKKYKKIQTPVIVDSKPVNNLKWKPIEEMNFKYDRLIKQEAIRIFQVIPLWQLVGIILMWIAAWIVSRSVLNEVVLPILFILAIGPISLLGSQTQTNGVYDWLRTVTKGQRHQQNSELIVLFLFVCCLLVPIMVKNPSEIILLLFFGLSLILLAQVLGTLFKNGRAFIGIMSVFWFIYLNGVTALLPLQKESNLLVTGVYVLLTILLIVLLQLKVLVKNRE